jgi:hypothetical protein
MSGLQDLRLPNVRLENVRRRKSYKMSIFYFDKRILKNIGNTKFVFLFLVKKVSIFLIYTLKRQYNKINNHEKCSINL